MNSRLLIASGVLLPGSMSSEVRADADGVSAPPSESFTGYGERVFRLQNALMDELLEFENADPPLSAPDQLLLAKAEARIVRSCGALNEVASLAASGHRPGFQLRMKAAASLRRCSASAHAVEKFLNSRPVSAGSP